jgi:hypothetical protein
MQTITPSPSLKTTPPCAYSYSPVPEIMARPNPPGGIKCDSCCSLIIIHLRIDDIFVQDNLCLILFAIRRLLTARTAHKRRHCKCSHEECRDGEFIEMSHDAMLINLVGYKDTIMMAVVREEYRIGSGNIIHNSVLKSSNHCLLKTLHIYCVNACSLHRSFPRTLHSPMKYQPSAIYNLILCKSISYLCFCYYDS